jgi:quercetin dioxygenase-like cupin family protein
MPAFNEIRHFELDPGVCVAHRNQHASRITVASGTLWVTLEGDAVDYWLRAGDSLMIAPQQRLWLSAETDAARFGIARALRPVLSVAAKVRQTGGLLPHLTGTVAGLLSHPR